MKDQLNEVIGHALETVFEVKEKIWADEKEMQEKSDFFAHIKVGTLLTVHAVIITDYGLYAKIRYSLGSMSKPITCGHCAKEGERLCHAEAECQNLTDEIPLDILATHCDEWEPEIPQLITPALH